MKYQKAIIKKIHIPFKISPPKIKYLGINLTKEVKDLYTENYKTLTKYIEDDSKKRRVWDRHMHTVVYGMTGQWGPTV